MERKSSRIHRQSPFARYGHFRDADQRKERRRGSARRQTFPRHRARRSKRRLAARLTGWKIDVKSLTAAEKLNLNVEEDEEEYGEEGYDEESYDEEAFENAEEPAPAEAEDAQPAGEAEEAEDENSGEERGE